MGLPPAPHLQSCLPQGRLQGPRLRRTGCLFLPPASEPSPCGPAPGSPSLGSARPGSLSPPRGQLLPVLAWRHILVYWSVPCSLPPFSLQKVGGFAASVSFVAAPVLGAHCLHWQRQRLGVGEEGGLGPTRPEM